MAAGMSMTLIWEISGQPWGIPTVYPALSLSLFCLIVVSLTTSRPAPEKWKSFHAAKS
jgi:hypothetical protein